MRYLKSQITADLKKKMVFLAGPRQVGKTTLALSFLQPPSVKHPAYLNWDLTATKSSLLKGVLPSNEKILVFDEIHKYSKWKNLIKGIWDTEKEDRKIIVTGSAMLNVYRRGQDSLLGRYHYYRLHPFSVSEGKNELGLDIKDLLEFGGFPEPLTTGTEKAWMRWNKERLEKIIFEDIRDLENIKTLELIHLLAEELPRRIGSPLSVKSLSEDLQKAHGTVENWLLILEKVFYCYRIAPFGSPKIRAVKKEKKLYMWDWRSVEDIGSRFENMVAGHLLKYCHYIEDTEGYSMELRFVRDIDGREIDFVVLKNKKPIFAVECKSGERNLSPNISYFKQRTNIPEFYQVHLGKTDFGNSKTTGRVLPFSTLCAELLIP